LISAPKIAIIGGSKEANDLAIAASKYDVTFFETETYRGPCDLRTRVYTDETDWAPLLSGFTATVVAPHPFGFSPLPSNFGIPVAALVRPPWSASKDDNWINAEDANDAAKKLVETGVKSPFLAIGRERLDPFNEAETPKLRVRYRNTPQPLLKSGSVSFFQPGPFTIKQEIEFLQREGIDCIVAHNAGGQGGWPKLAAARTLKIPVILIARPSISLAPQFRSVESTLNWLRQQVSLDL